MWCSHLWKPLYKTGGGGHTIKYIMITLEYKKVEKQENMTTPQKITVLPLTNDSKEMKKLWNAREWIQNNELRKLWGIQEHIDKLIKSEKQFLPE